MGLDGNINAPSTVSSGQTLRQYLEGARSGTSPKIGVCSTGDDYLTTTGYSYDNSWKFAFKNPGPNKYCPGMFKLYMCGRPVQADLDAGLTHPWGLCGPEERELNDATKSPLPVGCVNFDIWGYNTLKLDSPGLKYEYNDVVNGDCPADGAWWFNPRRDYGL